MMVMFREIFGKFETGELVVGGDPANDSCRLKVREVPIGGASRKVGKTLGNIVDADRMAGSDEHSNDGTTAFRIALIDAAQPTFDHGVQIIRHGLSRHSVCASTEVLVLIPMSSWLA